ncbi:S-layer homology domain-containing protein [Oscillospiraceae bacterium 50-16]
MKRRALSLITALALCLSLCPVRVWAVDGETGGESCPHHTEHTEECGYVAEDPDAPCTFVCLICPIEELIGALPASVSEDNWEQVQAQVEEIYDLCDGLTSEELQQVDLSACLALLEQIEGMEAEAQSTASGHSGAEDTGWTLENDHTFAAPYVVSKRYNINTSEYTLIGTGEAVIQVSGTGVLDFKGAIKSQKGVGVEVLSGGVLRISEQANIRGQAYALSVASGGEAHLSAGTYFGKQSAIWVEDGNYAALLEEGYAYFDENGDPIQPEDLANALTVVVQQCTEHNKTYTRNENAPNHTWSCSACQLEDTEKCTFTFLQDGTGKCDFCGRTIAIVVDEDALSNLVYDGKLKPEQVGVTVTLDNSGKELVRGTDYKVDIQSIKDAGQATVTVTGITFNGTFVRTYTVRQDQPGIEWDSVTCNVDYDSEGRPVDISKLPHITIKINAPDEDLHAQLEYSYRTKGTTDEFVNGLPTDAGTYEVKAYLLESQNYEAAETNPCLTLTINKINALIEAPVPTLPTYDGNSHALVTAGKIQNGAVIEYAREQNGSYTTDIPSGINAGDYTVWYRVTADPKNYNVVPETEIPDVKIKRKAINPYVTLSEYTYLYDGGEHQPKVTVKDEDNVTVILDTEYEVNYTNNRNVGTATVTVIDALGGNYELTAVAVEFKITQRTQDTLSITQKPNTVTYGDKFTLGTTGGSGSGNVTWKITDGTDVAEVDPNSGQVTVTGHGSATVKATKSGASPVRTPDGNYEDAIALWTFTAGKKPVTAVLTVTDRDYMASDTTAKVTAAVPDSELVSGDSITITGLTGTFEDPNAGTDKKVTVNSSNPTVTGTNWGNYDITYPAATTASILKADIDPAKVIVPTAATNLEYTSLPLALVTGGNAEGGTMEYSLDGTMYSASLPTGINAGNYDVWYRVKGDSNHNDTKGNKLDNPIVIVPQEVTSPVIEFSPSGASYDGQEHKPAVTVKDKYNRVIPNSEYTLDFGTTDWIKAGGHTVTVEDAADGNYNITQQSATFTISPMGQNPLSIVNQPGKVQYGDSFTLSTMGGSGTGAVKWRSSDETVATIGQNGLVEVLKSGSTTITATKAADGNYGEVSVNWSFSAEKKPVTPIVTAKDKPYDGTTAAELTASWKPGDLVGSDKIDLTVTGEFVTANVGTGKQVMITSKTPDGVYGNYSITWPASTTASISKVDAKLATAPVGNNLTYNGGEQDLVTGGSTEKNIGTIEYSLSQNGQYSTTIPTGKDAGKYTVWYRVAESVNYTGISAAAIEVEIKKVEPIISTNPTAANGTVGQSLSEIELSDGGATDVSGTFAWKDGSIKPNVGTSSQTVVFTPDDTANYTTVEFQVLVTIQAASGTSSGSDSSGSSTETSGPSTTVQDGTASTVLSASDGSSLVREAAASQSDRVVIKPEVTGDVTRTEVSIPASTVSRLQSETNAALTVSAPIADVTIPNQALDTLSSAGGTVNVATEQVDQAVVLTLTAGGEKVEELPGGLTLSVPVEDAGPGTVAVLVHEDGTRETIRKSVVEDGMVNIPLNGSATVEIVDNSKEFADVPSTNWAADAVAFASSHELFSGTSENTFSPNQPMSRGMLTTVLYNLEGRPEQDLTVQDLADGYSDVSSDAWYAGGIAWAAENGIASGYANGQFGPNDSITREQFAVMLWKYAGSPGSDSQLDFTDADQISGYAQTALRWAAEKGILSGYTNGQLSPKGTATRAEAAQMLKSFLENS